MKNNLLLVFTLAMTVANTGLAGTLNNGVWSSKNCGKQPDAPIINDSDIDAYNLSIAAINDWQQKSRSYFECVIQEANADNKLIVDSTNQAQATYKETLEKITAGAEAAAKSFKQQ